jgi:serine/threonine-protein kinase
MSPEQAAGATVKHTTDVYSLGVMLYEMAAGKVPFDAENFMGILTMHMYKAPVPMRALVPAPQEIPPGLDAVVLKCLSKKAEQRYESMDALVTDLEKLEVGQLPDAVNEMMGRSGGFNVPADYFRSSKMPPPMPGEPAGRRRGPRSKWPLIAGLAGVATAVGLVVIILANGKTTKADAPPVTKPDISTTVPVTTATATTPPTATTTTVQKKSIPISIAPNDAKIFDGVVELKSSMGLLSLELAPTETKMLTVSRTGYVSQTVTVKGVDDGHAITLVPIGGGPHPTATTHPTATSTSVGMGLGPDPFATADPKKH